MLRYHTFHMPLGRIATFIFIIQFYFPLPSQVTSFNFRHLTNTEGLSDGVVHDFVQDKYGFIWIGTSYGLNRFDGINIKSFFSKSGDSSSIANNLVQSLYCDSKSNLWIGTYTGLCRYDYSTNRFINYQSSKPVLVDAMMEDSQGQIWLGTGDGLWKVDEKNLSIQKFTLNDNPDFQNKFQCLIRQIIKSPDGNWYMASTRGIKIFNPLTNYYNEIVQDSLSKISISGNAVISVAIDSSGFLWATCNQPPSLLNKIDLKNQTVKYYDHFITADKKWASNSLQQVLIDTKGRVWITAATSGLTLYDETKDDFSDYKNDPLIPNSP